MEALTLIGIILLSAHVSAIIIFSGNYKLYSKIYSRLPNMRFVKCDTQVWEENWLQNSEHFVWFIRQNDFKIYPGVYLWSGLPTILDPYSYYWQRKFKRWFKENVNLETLPEA